MSKNTKKGAGGRLPTSSIKARAEALLRKTALPYDQVVARIKDVFPKANTSPKSVAWYASRMRAAGVSVKERPRIAAVA